MSRLLVLFFSCFETLDASRSDPKEQCSSSLNRNNASIPEESPSLSSMGREPGGFGPITEPEARGGTSCEVRKPFAHKERDNR
jgi:hypothetical protein